MMSALASASNDSARYRLNAPTMPTRSNVDAYTSRSASVMKLSGPAGGSGSTRRNSRIARRVPSMLLAGASPE